MQRHLTDKGLESIRKAVYAEWNKMDDSTHLKGVSVVVLKALLNDYDAFVAEVERLRTTIIQMREGGHELPGSVFEESLVWSEQREVQRTAKA